MKKSRFDLIRICALLIFAVPAAGQHLPVRVYKSTDGLGSSAVNSVMRDSHGFLWFATRDGLSRFDGLKFRTYHFEKPASPNITHLIERRNGDYLAAAQTGGVYRFNASTSVSEENPGADLASFSLSAERVLSESVGSLTEDADGNLWAAGGDDGLLRLTENADGKLTAEPFPLLIPGTDERPEKVNSLFQSHDKSLWVSTTRGLFRLLADGRRVYYETAQDSALLSFLTAIYEDRDGLIWIGTRNSVIVLKPESVRSTAGSITRKLDPHPAPAHGRPRSEGEAVELTAADNFLQKPVRVFRQLEDGRIWMVGNDGLAIFDNGKIFRLDPSQGFGTNLNDLTEDENGNVWVAGGNGVYKITTRGFNSYGPREGLVDAVHSIYQGGTDQGSIYVVSGDWFVSRWEIKDNGRFFSGVRPHALAQMGEPVWTSSAAFLDRQNTWWFLTEDKLFRFDDIKRLEMLAAADPAAVYDSRDFGGGAFYRMWEDSAGDLWISTRSANNSKNALTRLRRSTGERYRFSAAENYPVERSASAFAEDSQGALWFGFYYGGLARFRNGQFRLFTTAEGLPEGFVTALHVDRRNRLWISTSEGGVGRIDQTAAENPQFVRYTTAQGMASNNVRSLTEDEFGRIYGGTVRGIDRIEPESGHIKNFTTETGLPDDFVTSAFSAKNGRLWFGTRGGAAEFEPHAEPASVPPPILIGGLRVAGNKQPVSEFGQSEIVLPELNHRQNNLQIDFFSIGFASADRLRYQYRLENSPSTNWSQPTAERTLTFANLAPGEYEFAVRAVNAEGTASLQPAVVRFTIAPPTWQKRWFIGLCLVTAGLILFAFERYRAAKVKALRAAFSELSLSEKRFRQLVEQSPLGIMIFNPDGSLRIANQAYMDMWGTGFTFEDLKNWDFMHDEQLIAGGIVGGLQRAFAGEVVVFETMRYDLQKNSAGLKVAPEAGVVYIDSVGYPVKNAAGELREVICVLKDNTERYIAEENLEKMRAEKARELEQVRKRIAADLHDDIGSSLTQISILSEVLRQNEGAKNGNGETLNLIADASRELVDAMSDIVWAINPNKDHLSDLTGKMRRFAADSFTPCRIKFIFDAPAAADDMPLGANLRRELFLIFKEAVNNIVKHAGAGSVEIVFKIEGGELLLTVRDNGRGFPAERGSSEGHGLLSMKERALALGGDLQVDSGSRGTLIRLSVPLGVTLSTDNH